MYEIKLDRFEGPLDLLLQLIEKENFDITQVALASVAEQFLHYLGEVEDTSPEELADFLVVAAKLLHIKSKTLLPVVDFEEEENTDDLTEQLRMYREFVKASQVISHLIGEKRYLYSREKISFQREQGFFPPPNFSVSKMHAIFVSVIKGIEPLMRLPEKTLEKTISLKEKVEELKRILTQKTNLRFSQLLGSAQNRTEVVVSFMAILELVRERRVAVHQQENFHDFEIKSLRFSSKKEE
ncbi:MAG TPA: segregation/condensation protein A [Patescibacteria group bacterium]|nr:segregation/condensation protein A [Patescibacteria group bacterium]